MPFFNQRLLSFFAFLWLALSAAAPAADSGWLVYELKFTPDTAENINFHFYSGAYVVAPVVGGPSSLILTTEDGGRVYTVADNAARVFTAAGPVARKTVLSAVALNGSAQACYTAAGAVNHTLSLPGPKGLRSFRVAGSLRGTLIASDDDSNARSLPADGTLGMVGTAVIEGRLREDLTYNASQHASQADAVLYLAGLLDRYGYSEEGARPAAAATIEGAPMTPAPEGADPSLFPAGSSAEAAPDR